MSDGFVIDTPDGIRAFALLQVFYKLKLEVDVGSSGPRWRDPPAKQARAILVKAGQPDPGSRKVKVLEAYGAYLEEIGVKKDS